MAEHKGAREFTGEEISNLTLGQNGFDIINNTEITSTDKGIQYWVALKVVGGNAAVKAHTYPGVGGDDLATNGNYSTGSTITLEDGDMIYGAFDKVTSGSGDYILAYRGR